MGAEDGATDAGDRARLWWESRLCLALLVFAMAVPLLYPPIPPLVDLFGHMGRYRVALDLGRSPWLQQYYDYHWVLIGNLGVDVLVRLLAPLMGLEPAVKLIVLLIPPLTAIGFLWVAKEVHGRIPPTALFALPFALGFPFLFGFVNFALSMALAFLAFGLWLRLARAGRIRLRPLMFVPISIVIFFTHAYGWGTLGLLCFSAEAVRQHDRGCPWVRSGINATISASVMALPLAIMLVWRSGAPSGTTGEWFGFDAKLEWLFSALRDRSKVLDLGSVIVAVILIALPMRRPWLTVSRNLAFSALVLLLMFLLLPFVIFGSNYADMRLVPYLYAVALLGIRFRDGTDPKLLNRFAAAGIAFFLVRIGETTASFAIAGEDQKAKLQAIDVIPEGARVATLVGIPCHSWAIPRNIHLGAMVIGRRDGFSNDQWVLGGLNLLQVRYAAAGKFAADPSQLVHAENCVGGLAPWSLNTALRELPRQAFDYVWLIDPPAYDPRLIAGMEPVWRGAGTTLFRIRH